MEVSIMGVGRVSTTALSQLLEILNQSNMYAQSNRPIFSQLCWARSVDHCVWVPDLDARSSAIVDIDFFGQNVRNGLIDVNLCQEVAELFGDLGSRLESEEERFSEGFDQKEEMWRKAARLK